MAAAHVGAVARRIVLVERHVAEQPGAHEAALEQVVAEDAIRRQTIAEAVLERLDVVDALADEGAFAEEVLIDVRHRPRIRVDARLAAIQARIARPAGAGQADRHRGLQDAVAGHDAARDRVVAWAIQRVRHGRHQRPRRIARQLGVGVEGDDELDAGQRSGIAHHARKARARRGGDAAQQRVELGELAALALMPHPHAFLRVPAPGAMEEEEDVACGVGPASAIFGVECLDGEARAFDQRAVFGKRLLAGVEQVGEQTEMQAVVAIGQEAHFQRLDQFIDVVRTGEHGRHHHQRAPLRRNAGREVHARQRVRGRQQRGQPIHQGCAQPARGQQRKGDGCRGQQPGPCSTHRSAHRTAHCTIHRDAGAQGPEQATGDGNAEQRDSTEVEGQRATRRPRPQRRAPGGTKGDRTLERRPTLVDQVEADVLGAG